MHRTPTSRRWPAAIRNQLEHWVIDADDHLDVAWRRLDARLGRGQPRHVAAYRGYADERGAELFGRVLAEKPLGGPEDDDTWWDNLLNTYRRFESDEVPGVGLRAHFRGASVDAVSDHEGYYTAALPLEPSSGAAPATDALWENATVTLADGTLATAQPVMQVRADAGFGIISDIDDTVLQSSITDWKTAAQLTFLHNARTRKPLEGVAQLYQALQEGADRSGRHPVFYVSSSPWNLYDLLEDFMDLNAIPCGPIFLRDLGTDTGKFITTEGHGHKLERARTLIQRFPTLRWVLLGDSGQADAELYAEAAREFGDRIAAIYIRDVDPGAESPLDLKVDGFIEKVAGTSVPMLRSCDSLAIADHAAGLGLIDRARIPAITAEVQRDRARPTPGEAATDEAATQVKEQVEASVDAATGAGKPGG